MIFMAEKPVSAGAASGTRRWLLESRVATRASKTNAGLDKTTLGHPLV